MVINFVPGEECRIAILEEGRLEEFYAERVSADLHVGNIYLGKVTNVEPAIQAAFIDFGIGRNGFLHVSDLHPMYFPGSLKEATERVGQKTPHRRRPPIQECLKRGQQMLVQVIKEGIGTKGPTLSSYLSIPGRYLVIMPNMERLGVSRRVEDLDTRREMREALDGLDLPDNFGFILRTAGIGRTKTDLKRDLAYLQRLWKLIERKQKTVKAPAELYAESDLLLRTIRDVLSSNVNRIIVDDPGALKRIDEFLSIIAPRSRTTKLLLYDEPTPIFHAFGIEEQIRGMHSREAPLPGGGSLVIDATEAMVTIDVNSGRMRQAQDAETTAYRTNIEAVDEITRQLRLRDLGGLIVLDLIDMRSQKHRRDIENRLKEALKRDRAKTETLRISRFGIIEMTRQRMRPSLKTAHFIDCPACAGRGHIRNPESTATDAIHDLARVLQFENVARIEMVVGPTVASVILSRKRSDLSRLESQSGKHIDMRVSQTIAVDRYSLYAYDERSADIDLTKLLDQSKAPNPNVIVDRLLKSRKTIEELRRIEQDRKVDGAQEDESALDEVDRALAADDEDAGFGDEGVRAAEAPAAAAPGAESQPKRKRRRRRSKRGRDETAASGAPAAMRDGQAERPATTEPRPEQPPAEPGAMTKSKKKRRRRRRRGGRGAEAETTTTPAATTSTDASMATESASAPSAGDSEAEAERATATSTVATDSLASNAENTGEPEGIAKNKTKKKRRRRGGAKPSKSDDAGAAPSDAVTATVHEDAPAEPTDKSADQSRPSTAARSKKKRGGRRSTKKGGSGAIPPDQSSAQAAPAAEETATGSSNAAASGSSSKGEAPAPQQPTVQTPAAATTKPPRRLYRSRRKLGPADMKKIQVEAR